MIVIGTAGHIDHGKSAIVRRLTGTDPDRLPEEQERGMTIDLGFAFLSTPEHGDIAFVDVPGHERFVKNMIAGAGGIDAVMLVVAADDGWMPQSQEHFDIVRLLGVHQGMIVINKADLVEDDWLELLASEVRDRVKGSFLADAPLFAVSATTGAGFDKLLEYLKQFPLSVEERRYTGKARLFIDRSFVRPGMGGVVTGTLRGGDLSVGQVIAVWPGEKRGKIRSLQSRKADVTTAGPGQRTAVSFTGLDKEHLIRGGVITETLDLEYFRQNPVLALQVELLPNAPVPLRDGRRVTFIVGTTETEGEVRLIGTPKIEPGGQGLVLLKPRPSVYCLIGDHHILRLPTPMVTLGGGRVLDHLPRFPRKKELPRLGYLRERMAPGPLPVIISELHKRCLAARDKLFQHADFGPDDLQASVQILIDAGRVGEFRGHVYLVNQLEEASSRIIEEMTSILKQKSHLKGLSADEVAALGVCDRETVETLLQLMTDRGQVSMAADRYNLTGRKTVLKGHIKQAYDEIMRDLRAEPYAPPTLPVLARRGKTHQQAIGYILDGREAHKCGGDFLFLKDVWDEIVGFIACRLRANGRMAVTELRERFGFTRKFAIPILEETDRLGLTERQGDVRIKGEKFESTLADS